MPEMQQCKGEKVSNRNLNSPFSILKIIFWEFFNIFIRHNLCTFHTLLCSAIFVTLRLIIHHLFHILSLKNLEFFYDKLHKHVTFFWKEKRFFSIVIFINFIYIGQCTVHQSAQHIVIIFFHTCYTILFFCS